MYIEYSETRELLEEEKLEFFFFNIYPKCVLYCLPRLLELLEENKTEVLFYVL